MAKIVAKLNLNKTPQLVENNSLVMAKNIRLLEDGTIGPDTSLEEIETKNDNTLYVGQIVGADNKIYIFRESPNIVYSPEAVTLIEDIYDTESFEGEETRDGRSVTFSVNESGYVTRNGELFEDITIARTLDPTTTNRVKIYVYDEVYNTMTLLECGWKYSGGKINGCTFKNNTGNTILTICEYDVPGKFIPIKHINIDTCAINDNESIYTQAPNIPITNLDYIGEYSATIPAGVYQFFVRYKINDYQYTNWFPCSKEYFAGTKKKIATIQGELKYVDKHIDSGSSFIFEVDHLYDMYNGIYKKFQIGFILSRDDGSIIAREWKEFDFDITSIYFDVLPADVKEANIDDLLETTYEIFNVKNCVNFKNKLYIANYQETDFNPDLENLAKQIQINIKTHIIDTIADNYYFDNNILISSQNNTKYDYVGIQSYNNHIKYKWGIDQYFDIDNIEQDIDEYNHQSGAFTTIPFEEEEHHHIERSNVKETDIYIPNFSSLSLKNASVDDDDFETGYDDRQIPKNGWRTTVHKQGFDYKNVYALHVYIKNGNNWIDISEDYTDTHDIAYNSSYVYKATNKEQLITKIDKDLKNRISYFDITTNKWYIKVNSNYYPIENYYIVYCKITETDRKTQTVPECYAQHVEYTPTGKKFTHYTPTFDVVYTKKTINIIKRDFVFHNSYITTTSRYEQYPTLLPFSEYNFYIHYVKSNGVATNGYLINQEPVCLRYYGSENEQGTPTTKGNVIYYAVDEIIYTKENDNIILYPSFANIVKPSGYVGCFITASKVANNVCQLFNISSPIQRTENQNEYEVIADCLELDTLLYTKFDNITIYRSNGVVLTENANYYSSGNTDHMKYFGQSGNVVFTVPNSSFNDTILWLYVKTNKSTEQLIKFTPYIKLENTAQSYDDYNKISNLGYVCNVKKLNKNNLYISGNDIYIKTLTGSGDETVSLEDITSASSIQIIKNNLDNRIKSNFNLDYMNLSEDLAVQPRNITNGNNTATYLTILVNSLISSSIYEFNSWYKDYTRKVYNKYNNKNITVFDNTIRCSNTIGDEEYNTFKFNATDYYNVPTLRGIIINLISIVNSIYVHCEHSLYKFTDNRTLNAEQEEVVLQENDIFNSGITEIFDAQYGYAGLSKREHSLITYNSYVFYDEVARIIYAYNGQQQIENISNSISKLIKTINPIDVRFVADELHNRFFVNLINNSGNVCLSFNFTENSFISIHDIEFSISYHSRRNTYFIHENKNNNGTIIGWSMYKVVDKLQIEANTNVDPEEGEDNQRDATNTLIEYIDNYSAYQNCYHKSLIQILDSDSIELNNVNSAISCVDIIKNVEYEKIKVIDYINWICSEILEYGNTQNFVSEEAMNRFYPGTKLRIYSDSTATKLIDLLDSNGNSKMSNNERNIDSYGNIEANPNSWQYPEYNCGVWSMNYFRDIINITDIFQYKNSANQITGGSGHSQTTDLTPKTQRQNLTQENSLIYGKYFIIRFIFNNKNFKLENVILKMNDYGKTK